MEKISKELIIFGIVLLISNVFRRISAAIIKDGTDDVVYPDVHNLESGHKRVTIRSLQDTFDLTLEPAGKSISSDFTFLRHADGENVRSPNFDAIKRKLYRSRENGAVLHIDDDEGSLNIRGLLNSYLKIEPHDSERMTKDGRVAHRITHVTRSEKPQSKDFVEIPSEKRRTHSLLEKREERELQLKDGECYVINVAIIADQSITEKFPDEDDFQKYLFLQNIAAQNIIDTLDLNLTIRFIGAIAYTNETEPAFFKTYLDPSGRSYNLDVWGKIIDYHYRNHTIPLITQANGVMFATQKILGDGGMIGVAFGWSICNDPYKFALTSLYQTDIMYSTEILMHELAHMFGINHDHEVEECPPSHYIMGSDSAFYNVFSPCSRKQMIEFITKHHRGRCIVKSCNLTITDEQYCEKPIEN